MTKLLLLPLVLGVVVLDPLPAEATLSSIDVTLDRATAWRSRSKPGRIKARGTFRGVGGPFDMTQIVVRVTDGQDLDESGSFTSCVEFPSGKVRCQNDDRTSRIRYIPDRTDPELYRYKLDYRRRDITKPQVAPIQVEFDYAAGTAKAAAKNEPCRVYNPKLVCKGESAPVVTLGDVTIEKDVVGTGADPDQDFEIFLNSSDPGQIPPGTIFRSENDGPYVIGGLSSILIQIREENVPAPWTLADLTCTSASGQTSFSYLQNGSEVQFTLAEGDSVVCTFTNEFDSCSDGVQNHGETDVDCGGPCRPCPDGGGCGVDADCRSFDCTGAVCGPTVCPTSCVVALTAWGAHDFSAHGSMPSPSCGYDDSRQAGFVDTFAESDGDSHIDAVLVGGSGGTTCRVHVNGTIIADEFPIGHGQMDACAAIAAPIVEFVYGETCDVSAP